MTDPAYHLSLGDEIAARHGQAVGMSIGGGEAARMFHQHQVAVILQLAAGIGDGARGAGMNRRVFLRRFAAGVVGAAVLAHIPASVIKAAPRLAEPARLWACERLRTAYFDYVKAHGGGMKSLPAGFRVGRQFFELYEGELTVNMRFINKLQAGGTNALMFKGVPVMADGAGYHIEAYA